MTGTTLEEKVRAAEDAGVVFHAIDRLDMRRIDAEADTVRRKLGISSRKSADPLNKGSAFPLGVGFVRMTKRKEQAIDASVRAAGESVRLRGILTSLEKQLEEKLAGKTTIEGLKARAAKRRDSAKRTLRAVLQAKQGDASFIPGSTFVRLNLGRDGYPTSFTFDAPGVHKFDGNDKIDLAKVLFGGNKEELRAVVDEIRAEAAASQVQA